MSSAMIELSVPSRYAHHLITSSSSLPCLFIRQIAHPTKPSKTTPTATLIPMIAGVLIDVVSVCADGETVGAAAADEVDAVWKTVTMTV